MAAILSRPQCVNYNARRMQPNNLDKVYVGVTALTSTQRCLIAWHLLVDMLTILVRGNTDYFERKYECDYGYIASDISSYC